MAQGYSNQHIAIVPSKQAVVVRLGWTSLGARFEVDEHFSRILAALADVPEPSQLTTDEVDLAADGQVITEGQVNE